MRLTVAVAQVTVLSTPFFGKIPFRLKPLRFIFSQKMIYLW